MNSVNNLNVTIGVINHKRAALFGNCLEKLIPAIEYCKFNCELLVVNNSGVEHREITQKAIDKSNISSVCNVRLIDSPENNISVGRNIMIDHATSNFLLFIDDDEYAAEDWIVRMVQQMNESDSAVVVGPTYAVFPEGTPAWVNALDLHNNESKQSGQRIRRSGTGNCMLNLSKIGDQRFNVAYGRTGGGDSLFFDELWTQGKPAVWSAEAKMYEIIPEDRANSKYMIFRFLKQGYNFRRVVLRDAKWPRKTVFFIKAIMVFPFSLIIGTLALPINATSAAKWLKRGFINLGKLKVFGRQLYN